VRADLATVTGDGVRAGSDGRNPRARGARRVAAASSLGARALTTVDPSEAPRACARATETDDARRPARRASARARLISGRVRPRQPTASGARAAERLGGTRNWTRGLIWPPEGRPVPDSTG
jgi:hypothetical protein